MQGVRGLTSFAEPIAQKQELHQGQVSICEFYQRFDACPEHKVEGPRQAPQYFPHMH